MLIKINGVGNPKIAYKEHQEIHFDSLSDYMLLAKKSISKFGNKFYHGLSTKMLKDEDAIANVANAIMMADWRWDEHYQNAKGTKKNRYSYRNQCALWAIQTYVTKNHKKYTSIKNVVSLDFNIDNQDDGGSVHNLIEDFRADTPINILIQKETQEDLKSIVDNMLNLDCLSTRQKDYIKLYYFEGYTFEKIGKKYNITREAVRQGLNKAIKLLRSTISHD
jgi:RNA polymerase sigma factor (sigma-70 family)